MWDKRGIMLDILEGGNMSEQVYTVNGLGGRQCDIQFSDLDFEWGCLCTFDMNDRATGYVLTPHRVRALALLGAAVVLASDDEACEDNMFLPYGIPEWIQDEIKRVVPE